MNKIPKDNIDYEAVNVPTDKDPTEYHYTERRAEILQLIYKLGHPRAVNQGQLADRYGVTQSQISQDIDRLGKFVKRNIGKRSEFITEMVYFKSLKKLMDNQEYSKAVKVLESWNDWMFSIGAKEKAPEKVEFTSTGMSIEEMREVYEKSKNEEKGANPKSD